MSSELHIPSIIRPYFSIEGDDDGGRLEDDRKSERAKSTNSKLESNANYLPKVKKENAHVSFAPTVQAPPYERAKTIIPTPADTKVNVDHQHYEQWARNPNRKAPSTALLRGIQQLKAKMTREKESVEEVLTPSEPYKMNSFSNMLRERSNMSRSSSNSAILNLQSMNKQPKPPQTQPSLDTAFNKSLSSIRNILRPTQHIFDGVTVNKRNKKDNFDIMSEDLQRLNKKLESTATQEMLENTRDHTSTTPGKPRIGLAKIHDRNPFPVSVNQPVCIGDHVFLVNEPLHFKSPETWRLKTRLDTRGSEMSVSSAKSHDKTLISGAGGPFSASVSQHLKPSFPLDHPGGESDQQDDIFRGSLPRTGAYLGSFFPKKSNRRIPAVISSAELYDFSQLAELRTLHEVKFSERTKTEASIYLRGPKLTKWIPRSQRMSALLK